MQITALGDSALIVRLCNRFEDAPEEALDTVLRAFQQLQSANIPGVIELAPAYTSVAIFFDPITIMKSAKTPEKVFDWLAERVRGVVAAGADRGRKTRLRSQTVEIPVCYDPEFALDIDDVARRAKTSPSEVVRLHSGADYCVACIGFVPGFPFLAGLPKELATPRRDVPRKQIPPGSVGIGGAQTGIYPLRSPGGWNLIGRTPLRLFDPQKNPPALLRAGERVRFRKISRDGFAAFAEATAAEESSKR